MLQKFINFNVNDILAFVSVVVVVEDQALILTING